MIMKNNKLYNIVFDFGVSYTFIIYNNYFYILIKQPFVEEYDDINSFIINTIGYFLCRPEG